MLAELRRGEPVGQEPEDHQRTEQRLDPRVGEPQGRNPLVGDHLGALDLPQGRFAEGAVVAELLDVEETSVGVEADLPQGGEVLQPFAEGEVPRVVDRGLGPEGPPLLVVLLDPAVLVVQVERGRHPLGEDPRPEPPGGPPRDPAPEDQLHLVRPAEVQVLADDRLEEDPPGEGPVQELGQRELRLEDRAVVPVAGLAVGRGERVRQPAEPLPEKGIDLGGRQPIAEGLESARIGAGADAVVQGLEGNPALRQLPLDVLVPVETQLRRVGEVRTELEEERPKSRSTA